MPHDSFSFICCFPCFSNHGFIISHLILGDHHASWLLRWHSLVGAVLWGRVLVCTGPDHPPIGKTAIVLPEISSYILKLQIFSAFFQFSFVPSFPYLFLFKQLTVFTFRCLLILRRANNYSFSMSVSKRQILKTVQHKEVWHFKCKNALFFNHLPLELNMKPVSNSTCTP